VITPFEIRARAPRASPPSLENLTPSVDAPFSLVFKSLRLKISQTVSHLIGVIGVGGSSVNRGVEVCRWLGRRVIRCCFYVAFASIERQHAACTVR
jgi:hypothetical protein